jgi:hypothetical protein
MNNLNIHCVHCKTKVKVKNNKIYMRCLCNEDDRIINLDNIKRFIDDGELYILYNSTKGINYATMENGQEKYYSR